MNRKTVLLAPLLAIPVLLGQGRPEPQREILLTGKITAIDEVKSEITFKTGSKSLSISYASAKFARHERVLLGDLPDGTAMKAFARLSDDSGAHFDQIIVLVAGPFEHPHYLPKNPEEKPMWWKGELAFTQSGNPCLKNKGLLNCGKERPVCRIHEARIAEFYETDEKGRIRGKPVFIRGVRTKQIQDGEEREQFVARWVILPTTGIPEPEYGYILDPGKLNEELAAGKR